MLGDELTWEAEYAPTETTVYLSGAVSRIYLEACAEDELLGLMVQPGNSVHRRVSEVELYGADNGCYSQGDRFDPERWLRWLEKLPLEGCLFATLPDVYMDAAATWRRSRPHVQRVKDLGFPVALVLQNGQSEVGVPWDDIDCVFVGGDDAFKESQEAVELGREARRRGKWTHVGRVNGWKRLLWATSYGFDSVDGTYLGFGPKTNLPNLLGWVKRLRETPFLTDQEYRVGRSETT